MKNLRRCFLLFAFCFSLLGCATLQPGADPLVVRCQQAEAIAFSTFDTYVHLVADNEKRVKALAPAAYDFAEWLRAKTPEGTPRGLAMITSLGNVRRAYAAHRTPEHKASLLAALAALQSAVSESQRHLATVKP